MFNTVSWFELVFVLIVACGVGCGWICLLDAVRDRRALRKSGVNGLAQALVNGNVRNEVTLLSMQMALLAWGLLAAALPSPMQPSGRIRSAAPWLWWALAFVRIGFLLATVHMVINSLLNLRERRKTLRQGRRESS